MKSLVLTAGLLASILSFSCEGNKKNATSTAEVETGTASAPVSEETRAAATQNVITLNVGAYPHELDIFNDNVFSDRFKKLASAEYDSIMTNFNVETPIVSEGTVFKFTGCKQHNCPGFHTTVLYDAGNDNLNLLIEKDGDLQTLSEKGPITYTEVLKYK